MNNDHMSKTIKLLDKRGVNNNIDAINHVSLSDTSPIYSTHGSLQKLLNGIVSTIRLISGESNWYDTPTGHLRKSVSSVTNDYNVVSGDSVISVNSAVDVNVNLLTSTQCSGKQITIKNVGTGDVIINGYGDETIDGGLTQTIGSQWGYATIVSNGIGWIIISKEL